VKPPSPRQLSDAYAVLLQAKERLQAIDPAITEDERLFGDMLDGESGDAIGALDRLIACAIEAEDFAAQAHVRAQEIAERKARYQKRSVALRETAFQLMQALELRRRETGQFTASVRSTPPKVLITDETALPPALVRTRTEPDKLLIAAALKSGGEVPGATLSNATESLAIRTS
jgi:Gp157 protein